jgi:hypothetical protein
MSKKLITGCLGLLALAAFILPASASAANATVTHPTGVILNPAGKTCTPGLPGICITATNIGNTIMWNTGHTTKLIECTKATMTGSLITNTDQTIQGQIHTATFTGNQAENKCKGAFGNFVFHTNIGNGTPWCLDHEGNNDNFTVTGGACGSPRSITFVLTVDGIGTCKYSRAAAVEGTFTTHSTGDAILSVVPTVGSQFTKEEGGVLCPASGELEMSFTLETDTTASNDPLYISGT